ncbi:MAG: RNA-directed DNA polymerase [Magnetococcales bacterium]|nr:RNA-directed DNA polymerase [Magnetococcales bacterium]
MLRDHWEKINHITKNKCSGIKPQRHADGRLIIMDYDDTITKSRNIQEHAFGKRFMVHSDVSNCFPSIYAHAVPWALVGFEEAKRYKSEDEWFNQLDKALRLTKRGETQGIAIGPATSNIVSEIILARIDAVLFDKGHECFLRYIDDYTCYCESEEEAQNFISQLSAELSKFKLMLNIKKTEIRKLPEPMVDDWVISLTSAIPSGDSINEYQAIRFLEFALALSKKYPEGSVMKFAMKTLTKKPLDSSAKCAVFNYGLGLAFHHPLLLPFLDRSLADCKLLHDVSKKLNMIVREHARLHRSDGMTWGLYLLVKYHATIEECTADVIIGTADAMSIAVLYWSGQHLDKVKTFVKDLVGKDLYKLDAYWLLLYEVFRKKDISNPYRNSDCEVFQVLKERGVYFLADENTILDDDQNDTFSNLGKVLREDVGPRMRQLFRFAIRTHPF